MIVAGWSVLLFKKTNATLNPNKKPTQIITAGPYKISRNPMYMGLSLILLGFAFLNGELVFFAPPVIFFIIINSFVIPYEETMLANAIGNETFKNYSQKIRRWI